MGEVIGGLLTLVMISMSIGIWGTMIVVDTNMIQRKKLCENTSITIKEYKACMDLPQDELFKQLPKIKYKEKGEK